MSATERALWLETKAAPDFAAEARKVQGSRCGPQAEEAALKLARVAWSGVGLVVEPGYAAQVRDRLWRWRQFLSQRTPAAALQAPMAWGRAPMASGRWAACFLVVKSWTRRELKGHGMVQRFARRVGCRGRVETARYWRQFGRRQAPAGAAKRSRQARRD